MAQVNFETQDGKKLKRYPKPVQYVPKNLSKYIGNYNNIWLRSSWEIKFARWCDVNPAVLKWSSETVVIPYLSVSDTDQDGVPKMRNYYMDFFIHYRTSKGTTNKLLIEIKPYAQTIQPKRRGRKKLETFLNETKTFQVNSDKWDAAKKYAKNMGWGFKIMTEYELYPEWAKKGRPQ